MTLLVRVPPGHAGERLYAWGVLLGELLGLDFAVEAGDVAQTTISLPGSEGQVVVAEGLFAQPESAWLTPGSLPAGPAPRLALPAGTARDGGHGDVVAIFGAARGARAACEWLPGEARIAFDVAGSAFYMLSRYEEAVPGERDAHDRFTAAMSTAHRDGYLQRPVVNEYADLLFACLRHCWPGLRRAPRAYRVLLTHDVDSPLFHLGGSPRRLLSALAGDVLTRRDPAVALRRLRTAPRARRGAHDGDPHDTFDYLMALSERHGLRSAFYFIAGGRTRLDADYTMDHPWIQALVGRIGARGHEVGLHPSYATYLDAAETAAQQRTLRECAERNGVRQAQWGGRQHYLRWRAGTTWSNWEAAGLDYDSSVGYAEAIGFRSGCCHEHGTYDVVARRPLALRERPLLVMETTLLTYMRLGPRERLDASRALLATCRRHDGDATLLWHNSKVVSAAERREYEAIVDLAVAA